MFCGIRKLVMLFGLEKYLPNKEERETKGECLKMLLNAMDMPYASLEIKEARRISRYRQGRKGQPLRITFDIEICN